MSSFALRNLRSCLLATFCENYRVLKTGGSVIHLDFGRPESPLPRFGHRVHLRVGVPLIGQWLCGGRWPKHYLETTIAEFDSPEALQKKLRDAGFQEVRATPLLWGTVMLYEGVKRDAR